MIYFTLFSPPPPKKKNNWGAYKICLSKMKIVQNCLKWRENWLKMILKLFSPPPKKKIGGLRNFFVKNENCSKLPEMARKLVEKDFWTFNPPKKMGGVQFVCQIKKI